MSTHRSTWKRREWAGRLEVVPVIPDFPGIPCRGYDGSRGPDEEVFHGFSS